MMDRTPPEIHDMLNKALQDRAILLAALQAFADRAEDEFQVTLKREIASARSAIKKATTP